jgi:hypothetical protein
VSENGITPSSGEQMMNCPKCGFEQPVDQYCAKCGVDMAKALKRSSGTIGLFKNPAAIAGFVILLGGIGLASYRNSMQPSEAIEDSLVGALSESASDARAKSRLSAKASDSVAENLKAIEDLNIAETETNESDDGTSQTQANLGLQPETNTPQGSSRKAVARPTSPTTATPQSTNSTSVAPGLLVVFAWAEVSREWLQAMGTTEPGFHQVPGLETRLRQSSGSFRIVDVTRRRLTDDAEPVVISKADQSVVFEPISVKPKSLTGGFTAQFKSALGEIRAPASATASLVKGTGAIVPMGPSTSTQGTEIVVFILPRWEND